MSLIKQQLAAYGKKIAAAHLVAGAGGNISGRDGEIIWMKPSGFAMDDMDADDLCGIRLASGEQIKGEHKPTSEVSMHLAIYRERPDVHVIFHTHSPWASGVISSGTELKPMFAEYINDLGRTGTVPYITPTTQALAEAMGEKAKTCDTIFMVNHGVLATGASMKQAYYRAQVVEDAAISFVAATVVGKPRFLSQDDIAALDGLTGPQHRVHIMEKP